jgi:hypothetical protein
MKSTVFYCRLVSEWKDLGPVRQFLGLEISRNGDIIALGQQAYIDTILQRFEMSTAYGVQTPLDPNVRLDGYGQQGGVEVDPTQYQTIVGSLMYAALGTRPDNPISGNRWIAYVCCPGHPP